MEMILFALWFFLPAGYANVVPVFAAHMPLLKKLSQPLDFNSHFRGKRLFGNNKTWRGLILGVAVATLTIYLQRYLYGQSEWIREISRGVDYQSVNIWLLGPLLGVGALLGDAIESFFKRQAGVAPGAQWFPFDQTDYIAGGLLLSSTVVLLSAREYVSVFLVWFGIHIIASYIGFLMGLKSTPI